MFSSVISLAVIAAHLARGLAVGSVELGELKPVDYRLAGAECVALAKKAFADLPVTGTARKNLRLEDEVKCVEDVVRKLVSTCETTVACSAGCLETKSEHEVAWPSETERSATLDKRIKCYQQCADACYAE